MLTKQKKITIIFKYIYIMHFTKTHTSIRIQVQSINQSVIFTVYSNVIYLHFM